MIAAVLVVAFALQTVTPAPPQWMPPPQAGAASLEGEWNVEAVDNIKVMPDSRVTMKFQGTRVSGLASCNTYSGTYTLDGTALQMGSILSTMKACSSELMSQERDFLQLLRNTARCEVQGGGGTLVLTTATGKVLTARRFTSPGPR